MHAIVVTHVPDRVRRTLLGVAWSSRRADTVTVSVDGEDPGVEAAARAASEEAGIVVTVVTRARGARGRPGAARNEGVRALEGAGDGDVLVFLDGDCVPEHRAIERHEAYLRAADVVIGWRFDLTPEQTEAFDEGALREGRTPFEPEEWQERALEVRHRRFERQLVLRRLGLAKGHKPKLLSANFSCTVGVFRGVNGFDESFEGWGQEDDDLGRRIYQAGGRARVAVRDVVAFHQYHPTRAPGAWSEGVNAWRLRARPLTRCVLGLDRPGDPTPARRQTIAPLPQHGGAA